MIASSGGAIDLRTLFESHRHSIAPGQTNDLLQPVTVPPAGDKDRLHWPSSGQRFPDSVDARQLFHCEKTGETLSSNREANQSWKGSLGVDRRDRLGGDCFAPAHCAYALICFGLEVDA